MSIYTRTGDKGTTSLFGGRRVSKSDLQIEAYGCIDELTCFIGLVAAKIKGDSQGKFLVEIQKDLYKIMAYLSGAKEDLSYLEKQVLLFEKKIDEIEKKLPKLTRFIIPGGNELSAWFHILRSICRRSERSTVRYFNSLSKPYTLNPNPFIIKYLNRLSDLFFILSRWYGRKQEILT